MLIINNIYNKLFAVFLSTLNKYSIYLYPVVLNSELQLDSLKQKGAVKRTLFFDYHQSNHYFFIVMEKQKKLYCQDFLVYLRVSLKYFGLSS